MAIVAFVLTIPVGTRALGPGRAYVQTHDVRFTKLADIPDDYWVGVGTDRLNGDNDVAVFYGCWPEKSSCETSTELEWLKKYPKDQVECNTAGLIKMTIVAHASGMIFR